MITIYQYLLDKVRKKLEGWKLHTLFRTARVALIKSALAASPIYFMQMTTIPKTILKEIECCCRQLTWGEMDGDCKLHTIRWATLWGTYCRKMGYLSWLWCRWWLIVLLTQTSQLGESMWTADLQEIGEEIACVVGWFRSFAIMVEILGVRRATSGVFYSVVWPAWGLAD